MTIRHKLTAFIFAILIVLPTFDQLLSLSSRFITTENRQLNQMPVLNFPHIRSFVREFDAYYKENFGWRNALFYMYSNWKFNILGESPLPEKVVVGKNGWLFLGNSDNRVIDQYRGLKPLSADSAQLITSHLLQRQQELTNLNENTQLYVIVPPNSHTIYSEYLPDNLQLTVVSSPLDALLRATKQTNLRFVDVRDTLRVAKRKHVVYYQTDTHWNEFGTLVACATLLKYMRRDYPTLRPMQLSDYHVEQQPRGVPGDLITMLMMQEQRPKDQLCYDIKPVTNWVGRKVALEINPLKPGLPSTRFVGCGLKKLLFVGDSFSEGMMPYLAGYFRESYFVRGSKLDSSLVQAERPDVIVIEVVERNINLLATF